jgi:hypothetical protein
LKKAQENKVQWCAEYAVAIQRFWNFYQVESISPEKPEPDERQGMLGEIT